MRVHARASALALLLVACGGEEIVADPEPPVPSSGCAPGELDAGDACLPAGILAEECPAGFEGDDRGGCRAIQADCPVGQVAWIGEAACHPVAPCPAGPWPEVTVEPGAQFVDSAYAGGDSDGSQARPWTTLQAAFDVAPPGAQILLAAGSHQEDAIMRTDGLRLLGACPDLVRLEGVAADRPALFINGADGGSLRGVTLSGPGAGLAVQDAADVVVEDLVVSDVGMRGLVALPVMTDVLGLTMRRILVERTVGAGAFIGGGAVTLEDVIIRDVTLEDDWGDGITIAADASLPPTQLVADRIVLRDAPRAGIVSTDAELTLTRSRLSGLGPHADGAGLWTQGTDLDLDGVTVSDVEGAGALVVTDGDLRMDRTTIRDVRPSGSAPGVGVVATPVTRSSPALEARRVTIGAVHTMGLITANTITTLERLRIEDVGPDPIDMAGAGLSVATFLDARFGDGVAQIDARAVVVERVTRVGLGLYGAEGALSSVAVRDALPGADGSLGRCLDVEIALSADRPSVVALTDADVGPCREGGVFLFGSTLEAERVAIHDVTGEGGSGYGLAMHFDPETFDPPMGSLRDSTVRDVTRAGVLVSGGGRFALEGVTIAAVKPGADGFFGDGVVVRGADTPEGYLASEATISASSIEDVARAGVSSFSGTVTIADNDLSCNPIALNHEPGPAGEGFIDDGGNRCACGDEVQACKALSSELQAPEPPSPAGSPL